MRLSLAFCAKKFFLVFRTLRSPELFFSFRTQVNSILPLAAFFKEITFHNNRCRDSFVANGVGNPEWLMALMSRLGKKVKVNRTTSSADKNN